MKNSLKILRHIIALVIIVALSFFAEFYFFNRDSMQSNYSVLRYNVPENADQTNAATGYTITSKKTEKESQLTDEEQNEIIVRLDNERKIAEYNGVEFVPDYGENIEMKDDGNLYRMIKQIDLDVDLGGTYYIKKLKMEADVEKTSGYTIETYIDDKCTKDNMYCSLNPKISAGVMTVQSSANHLKVSVLSEQEINEEDIVIEISNQVIFNYYRIFYFIVALFVIYMTFFAGLSVWKKMKEKPQWFFLIYALLFGSLIIGGVGTNMVSYDEYAHAKSAYKLSFGTTIYTTEAAMQMVGNTLPYFNNPEERALIEAYEDVVNDPNYIAPDIGHQTRLPRTETRVYYPMAAGFYLGRVLNLGFADMMAFARFGNLLCFVFIVFWAVKLAKGYGMVVAGIGLLPNNIFVSSSLSYDPLVNACLLLACVLMINELIEPDEKMKPGNAFLMLFAFLVGCLSKPPYILLAMILLFLPTKKFYSKKAAAVFKIAVLGLAGLMMYNIFFPTPVAGGDYALVTNNAYAGDKRNIGTSTMGQLKFVLENPFVYLKILLSSMWKMIMDYLVRKYPYVTYAYLGNSPYWVNYVCIILGVAAALFANVKKSVGKFRGFICHFVMFGVVAVVFSSMYISYTPVGNEEILGVQGRYVIPMFMPFLGTFLG